MEVNEMCLMVLEKRDKYPYQSSMWYILNIAYEVLRNADAEDWRMKNNQGGEER